MKKAHPLIRKEIHIPFDSGYYLSFGSLSSSGLLIYWRLSGLVGTGNGIPRTAALSSIGFIAVDHPAALRKMSNDLVRSGSQNNKQNWWRKEDGFWKEDGPPRQGNKPPA